ncbi:TetR/AcrR family transcriptional regulator [Marinoscillum furvescens]|uniref:TetR family transcriptional regulator n=1 Tax=Marinoscillum furvescens DSM 4134 TaxID=1122208 RepID=A0A3D9L279_MARFU|nr:TetR/AcrR family transcriptional regulator [Marinoscillum furvescens]RED98022.1 TetR family transcriptional regulator [Marinoscillum furvescens DSM 4134]
MRNAEATKELIVTRAMPLFNTKGYRATSLSDITKATGVTKGAIYGNFNNKDAVAVASFTKAVDLVISELRKEIKGAPTAPLKLKAILNYYSAYIENPPIEGGCPVINTSVEADDEHPQLRTRAVATIAMIKDSLKQIIHRGIIENQLRKDTPVERFATSFYAMIKGAILIARVEGHPRSLELIKEQLAQQIDNISS